MNNVIHGKTKYLCMWTGEVIEKKFKIPTKGAKFWSGCYGSPGACLSALKQHCSDNNLNQDQFHELHDILRASLKLEPEFKDVKFTIEPAPSFKSLKEWGGVLSLEEYHAGYNHDSQVKMYYQDTSVVPQMKEGEEGDTGNLNAPKKWRRLSVSSRGGLSMTDEDQPKVLMPRCIKALNGWLRGFATDTNSPNRVTLYFHASPGNNCVFAVGAGGDTDTVNRTASEFLGKTPIHGDVVVFSKSKMLIPKRKSTGASPAERPAKRRNLSPKK